MHAYSTEEYKTETHGYVYVVLDENEKCYSIVSKNGHLISFNDSSNIIDLKIKLQNEINQMMGKKVGNGI